MVEGSWMSNGGVRGPEGEAKHGGAVCTAEGGSRRKEKQGHFCPYYYRGGDEVQQARVYTSNGDGRPLSSRWKHHSSGGAGESRERE